MPASANLAPLLETGLRPDVLAHLRAAAALAIEQRVLLYLVGGSVRDLLLGLHPNDLDLTVEGDAPALARALATRLGGRLVVHDRFGTATVKLPRAHELDVATARAETYVRPGALPDVRPGTLADDLARRDFAINAVAVRLDGNAWGDVVDPHGGRGDITSGIVRALHDRSFVDDPTRLFRAVRYAGRLGFAIDPETWRLMCRDAGQIVTLTPDRVRHELELLFLDRRPDRALALARAAGLLPHLHPALTLNEAALPAFASMDVAPAGVDRRTLGFALLGWDLAAPAAGELAHRLNLTSAETNALIGACALRAADVLLPNVELSDSAAAERLSGFPAAAVAAAALRADAFVARERAHHYLAEWRSVRPALDGRAVLALGVPAGPPVGAVLKRLRAARLDGLVQTQADEERLVREWLQSAAGPATTEGTTQSPREEPPP